MKRFALAIALVGALAVVLVPGAAGLAFADTPCIETHAPSGILLVCPSGTVGASYSTQLAPKDNSGNGPPYKFILKAGSLPGGLSLSSSGLISGVPNGSGTAVFGVELQDKQGGCVGCGCVERNTCAYRDFSIAINAGFRIDNEVTSKVATIGQAYSDQLTATVLTTLPPPAGGPKASAAWTVISGTLPPGIALSQTGLLSGTPTASGNYAFKVKAEASGVTDEETFTVDVKPAVVIAARPSGVLKSEVGVALDLALTATGGDGTTYAWTFDGTVPGGMTFNATEATLSGTPTEPGSFTFSATATDPHGRAATYKGRIVVASKLVVTKPVAKPARQGKLYRLKLRTTGGVAPLKWKVTKGPLPKGVKLDKATGVISGKPTKAGRYKITVEATDSLKVKSTRSFTIVVQAAPAH